MALAWGRGGLEPPTSAVIGPERCASESGRPSVRRGVIRRDFRIWGSPCRIAKYSVPIRIETALVAFHQCESDRIWLLRKLPANWSVSRGY